MSSEEFRQHLPPAVQSHWQRLDVLDAAIRAGIRDEESSAFADLAEERSALLRSVCEALEVLGDPALRESAFRALADENTALLASGSEALARAAAQSAAGVHQRRAISAYGAQES